MHVCCARMLFCYVPGSVLFWEVVHQFGRLQSWQCIAHWLLDRQPVAGLFWPVNWKVFWGKAATVAGQQGWFVKLHIPKDVECFEVTQCMLRSHYLQPLPLLFELLDGLNLG